MSLISDAIKAILTDQEIHEALLAYIRAITPSKKEVWREIWSEPYFDNRTSPRNRNIEEFGLSAPVTEYEMVVVAHYNDEAKTGWIRAYLQPYSSEFRKRINDFYIYNYIYEKVMLGTYTEVIKAAQSDAFLEARDQYLELTEPLLVSASE